jgi:Xaa-Pro aminopeptidase
MVKTEPELERIRQAITLADEAFVHVSGWLEPGMTEQQVAWELESYMRLHGAEAISFPTIVASGPNSAKTHARPTDRRIQAGEPLVLDFGCVVDGYCSDITRTICLGEPADDRYLSLWQLISRAQQAALTGAKAGMTGDAVDKLARDIIVGAGFGDNFGHSLGHGIGLAVHELPRYSYAYPHQVYAGSVMTIEPGVYFPDWGGVRLEDVVLVGEDGVEILTKAPQQPILNGG